MRGRGVPSHEYYSTPDPGVIGLCQFNNYGIGINGAGPLNSLFQNVDCVIGAGIIGRKVPESLHEPVKEGNGFIRYRHSSIGIQG